jgi:hypothetical protein
MEVFLVTIGYLLSSCLFYVWMWRRAALLEEKAVAGNMGEHAEEKTTQAEIIYLHQQSNEEERKAA